VGRLRIGLTGGIASGKTTVAERFLELGVPVIDADQASRAVVAPGEPGLAAIRKTFGADVISANGELDRRALRNLIFADPARRRDLEAILHPLIRNHMQRAANAAVGPYLVMAIPLLVEARDPERVDRILVVDVDAETQLDRVVARDASTREQAGAIIAAQVSRAERLRHADDVIENSGTVDELRQAVDRLHEGYLRLAGAPRFGETDLT
jgi:dephospho-CoA kinase